MRPLTLALFGLLVLVHASLWAGRSSVPHVMGMRAQLRAQQAENQAARERNQRLAAEVGDLKEGLEMVEEKARAELGMVKPNEILVQISAPR